MISPLFLLGGRKEEKHENTLKMKRQPAPQSKCRTDEELRSQVKTRESKESDDGPSKRNEWEHPAYQDSADVW